MKYNNSFHILRLTLDLSYRLSRKKSSFKNVEKDWNLPIMIT